MKYMLTWTERPQGSPVEYENAQKRILEVFTGADICCWTATIRQRYTNSAQCFPRLSSKRDPLFPSTMPYALKSNRSPSAIA
jgi:hypothetical protein